MISGLIGKKMGMTQVFDREGNIVPVTALEVGPCTVVAFKENPLKVALGFELTKESRLRNPQKVFYKKLSLSPMRIIREFRSSDNKDYKIGQEIKADFFKAGDFVDVTGTSIGKGFQGGMKRHHWKGGPAAHGSMHHRRVGSIGASTYPSRVFKGHRMPGHMGMETVTVQSLRVMQVDPETNTILVKGAIPGNKRNYILIKRSLKKSFRALDEVKIVVEKKINPMKQSKKAVGKGK